MDSFAGVGLVLGSCNDPSAARPPDNLNIVIPFSHSIRSAISRPVVRRLPGSGNTANLLLEHTTGDHYLRWQKRYRLNGLLTWMVHICCENNSKSGGKSFLKVQTTKMKKLSTSQRVNPQITFRLPCLFFFPSPPPPLPLHSSSPLLPPTLLPLNGSFAFPGSAFSASAICQHSFCSGSSKACHDLTGTSLRHC